MSGSLLSVLLDVNQINWNKINAPTDQSQSTFPTSNSTSHSSSKNRFTLDEVLDAVCVAVNIHFSLDPANEILFYIFDSEIKELIFPLESEDTDDINLVKKGAFDTINDLIVKRIFTHIQNQNITSILPQSKMAGALSKCLCNMNKIVTAKSLKTGQILMISTSEDYPLEYISFMNAVLAADKLKFSIDSMIINNATSNFLKQASSITNGSYSEPDIKAGILQYFLQLHLTDKESRNTFLAPKIVDLKLQATCHCCSSVLDKGFICSICLRLFCEKTKEKMLDGRCMYCKSRFDII